MMNALLRKLERFETLTRGERDAVEQLCAGAVHHRGDEQVGQAGTIPILLHGFAYRFKLLSDGRRQIHGLFVSGDLCRHIYGHLAGQGECGVRTLTPSLVASVQVTTLLAVMEEHPRIAKALWANTVADDALLREWVVSLGRRTAYERMAHLFCEVFLRLRAVGQAEGESCDLPLTQMDLGDLMGLSTVHVNRVLQQLRRDGLIALKGSQLTIRDVGVLSRAADLDPSYLGLDTLPSSGRTGTARAQIA
ncbi:Crp/Fnr family transcriptional regulator [Lichenibacterium ramalinae]|uniref:Crp/Fnr family transcriptional regulator n=1 Tax=Lichenibacterium ramalinae TaxID=2316527 RepID=A0A4Q2RCC9_9HYPH|nr:Crp/Fnr family transcriptional regulator [Lichenibacterium ramalinae]RYB04717.1 Crp/Fnr family transcriptional regulator [Lichenibacterium ramalinae]